MIKKATAKDIPVIMSLYEAGLRELGETVFVESLLLNKVVSSYHLAPCFLLMKDDNIIGMAGLTIITSPWNGDATLSDYMFYILPEYRCLKNFSGLINVSKDFAREQDVPLRLEFASNVSEDVRKRLFKMHSFEVCSVVGMYEKDEVNG